MSLDVTELIKNVTVLVNAESNKALGVALDNLANDVLVLISDLAISNHTETLETSEDALRLGLALVLGDHLDATNDVAGVIPDLAVVIDLTTVELLRVTLNKTGNRDTFVADDVALLVDGLALEGGQIFRLRSLLLGSVFLLIALGMSNNRALLVEDIAVLVDSTADELLGVALNHVSNAVVVLVLDEAALDNGKALETSERRLIVTLLLGNGLSTANDVALAVPELALGIAGDTRLGKLLRVTFGELADDVAVAVDHLASLVDLETVKDGQRWEVVLSSILSVFSSILSILGGVLSVFSSVFSSVNLLLNHLGDGLDLSEDVAILVNDLTLLVDFLAGALLNVALSKLTDGLTLFVEDLTLLVDLEALKNVKLRSNLNLLDLGLDLSETLLQLLHGLESGLARDNLDLANRLALLVEDLALFVDGLASAVLGLAFGELTNLLTLSIKDLALLVDLEAFQDANVQGALGGVLELLGGALSKLNAAKNIALRVDDLALLVDSETLQVLDIALEVLSDLADNFAVVVENLALGVDLEAFERLNTGELVLDIGNLVFNVVLGVLSGVLDIVLGVFSSALDTIDGRLVINEVGGIGVDLSTGKNIAIVVKDLAVLVELLALNILWVAFDQLTNEIAILVQDLTSAVGSHTLEDIDVRQLRVRIVALELSGKLVLGKKLAAANEITIIIEDLAVVADGVASEILGITLDKAADGLAVLLDEALLVNLKTLEKVERQTTSLVLDGVLDIVGCVFGGVFYVTDLVVSGGLGVICL